MRLSLLAVLLAGVLAVGVLVVGHGSSASRRPAGESPPRSVTPPARAAAATGTSGAPTPPAARSHRRSVVQQLSLAQLAGQRIVYSYSGLTPPSSLLAAIRAGEAGGVIFFAPNVSSPRQLRAVINQLQRASLASPTHKRLLMLTDQEGGEVRRLPGAPVLSEKQIGQSRSRSLPPTRPAPVPPTPSMPWE